jgi:hypothetical protein
MKATMGKHKHKTGARLLVFILLTLYISHAALAKSSSKKSSSKSKKKPKTCLVDKCASCVNKKEIVCTACKPGWYLRTFTSGEKTYNACWSITKLILALLGLLLLSLLCCGICAVCYTLGKKAYRRMPMNYPEMPTETYSPRREITRPKVYLEEPPVVEIPTTPRYIAAS